MYFKFIFCEAVLSVNIFLKTENEPLMSTEVIGAYLKQVVCQ
jgi:hypothetical protein